MKGLDNVGEPEPDLLRLAQSWLDSESTGRIIISDTRKMLWQNSAGERFLSTGKYLSNQRGQIVGASNKFHHIFETEIASAIQGRRDFVLNVDATSQALISAVAIAGQGDHFIGLSVNTIADPELARFHHFQNALSLTSAEYRLACELLTGCTAEQCAKNFDVSIETVRTHIRSIYLKLNISSREELFQRLLRYKLF